jgi:ketosteroid isomerase-like protein
MFKIEVLDTFINECQTSGNEISFEKFGSINESYSIGEQSVNIPQEIFEAYMKYADVTGTEMVTLNEFEKIKSFAEFIQDKEAEGDVSTEEPATEEPAAEEPAAEEPAAEEPAAEEPAAEEPAAEEPAAEEPAAEEPAAEEPAAEEPKKDEEELDLGLENLKANETVATQPEPVAPTKEETEDDERHQTKIDPETTDGQATADRVYDKINKMGEPAKDSAGTAGEKDGKHLEDLDATVAPVKENADLEDEGAQVKPKEGEEDDAENGTAVPQVATDGQKTAADIATQTMVMGEPETASAGDAGEKKGEKLEGEPENVTPVKETLGMDIAKVDDPEEEIDDKERLEAEEIEKQKNPVAEKKKLN